MTTEFQPRHAPVRKRRRPGKSEALSRWLHATGLHFLLSNLPQRNSLLVVNYHRIGDADTAAYAPQVFSATAEEFQAQMEFIAHRLHPVTLDQALAWVEKSGVEKSGVEKNGVEQKNANPRPRCHTLVTFDDGYLDNFEVATPILRKLGMQGVFFLPTSFIGTFGLPWWDSIAYIVRNAANRRFSLQYPAPLSVDIEASGLFDATYSVQNAYKLPAMKDEPRFLRELETAAGCSRPDISEERCFMNWDEARRMIHAGMAIGAHTHTHRLLASLSEGEQLEELTGCRGILRQNTGFDPTALAYPVGLQSSFTDRTKAIAAQAGFRAAFSFYGGVNHPGSVDPYDIVREGVYGQSVERFRTQAAMAAVRGRYWP